MGIFLGGVQIQGQASKPHGGQQLCFFHGWHDLGKTVTERFSMQVTAVYSCIAFCRDLSQDCRFIYTNTRTLAARLWLMTIRCIGYFTMSLTRR